MTVRFSGLRPLLMYGPAFWRSLFHYIIILSHTQCVTGHASQNESARRQTTIFGFNKTKQNPKRICWTQHVWMDACCYGCSIYIHTLQVAVHHGPATILLRLGASVLSQSVAPRNISLNCHTVVLLLLLLLLLLDDSVAPHAHRFWENAVAP